jgi:two-component system response regulator GlrR
MTLTDFVQTQISSYLHNLLAETKGNVAKAARLAGRNRTEFYRVLKRYGI